MGKLVLVDPLYGFGWSQDERMLQGFEWDHIREAGGFQVRLSRFFEADGLLRGAVGQVEHNEHSFDGFWVVFAAHAEEGVYDFHTKICPRVTLKMGKEQPMNEGWPEITGQPQYSGYAYVAESLADIEAWRKQRDLAVNPVLAAGKRFPENPEQP